MEICINCLASGEFSHHTVCCYKPICESCFNCDTKSDVVPTSVSCLSNDILIKSIHERSQIVKAMLLKALIWVDILPEEAKGKLHQQTIFKLSQLDGYLTTAIDHFDLGSKDESLFQYAKRVLSISPPKITLSILANYRPLVDNFNVVDVNGVINWRQENMKDLNDPYIYPKLKLFQFDPNKTGFIDYNSKFGDFLSTRNRKNTHHRITDEYEEVITLIGNKIKVVRSLISIETGELTRQIIDWVFELGDILASYSLPLGLVIITSNKVFLVEPLNGKIISQLSTEFQPDDMKIWSHDLNTLVLRYEDKIVHLSFTSENITSYIELIDPRIKYYDIVYFSPIYFILRDTNDCDFIRLFNREGYLLEAMGPIKNAHEVTLVKGEKYGAFFLICHDH